MLLLQTVGSPSSTILGWYNFFPSISLLFVCLLFSFSLYACFFVHTNNVKILYKLQVTIDISHTIQQVPTIQTRD